MVEDVEESRLGALAGQVLDVVYNKDVDLHVVGQEVRELVAHVHGVHILGFELVAGDIEHHEFGELLLDGKTGRLGDVGFAKTRTAEDEQRVERGFAGVRGDVFRGVYRQTVAVPHHQVLEIIGRIEPGVDLHLGDAREHEGSGVAAGLPGADADRFVGGRIAGTLGIGHRTLTADGTYGVYQTRARTYLFFKSCLDHIEEGAFKVFAEELGGNFHGERGILQRNGRDFAEPDFELARLNYLRYEAQTVVPGFDMSPVTLHDDL